MSINAAGKSIIKIKFNILKNNNAIITMILILNGRFSIFLMEFIPKYNNPA